jgi:hypothetical protein
MIWTLRVRSKTGISEGFSRYSHTFLPSRILVNLQSLSVLSETACSVGDFPVATSVATLPTINGVIARGAQAENIIEIGKTNKKLLLENKKATT